MGLVLILLIRTALFLSHLPAMAAMDKHAHTPINKRTHSPLKRDRTPAIHTARWERERERERETETETGQRYKMVFVNDFANSIATSNRIKS